MQIPEAIGFTCVAAYTLAGLVSDLKTRKLPNVLTVPFFVAGLLYHVIWGFWDLDQVGGFTGSWHHFVFAMQGFGVGFGILFVLWLVGGSGGGDVKFAGALGCWLGAWLTFQIMVLSALLSGIITLLILSGKTFRLRKSATVSPGRTRNRGKKDRAAGRQLLRSRETWIVPFGVPVAMATWFLVAVQWAGCGMPWPPIPLR
jgi:prepilin peptidase CpaA